MFYMSGAKVFFRDFNPVHLGSMRLVHEFIEFALG